MRHPLWIVAVALATASPEWSGCAAHVACTSQECIRDRSISANVERVIRRYPALQAPNSVRVETAHRVVYLYGQVDTELERQTAQEAALSVDGVIRVVNSIALDYAGR